MNKRLTVADNIRGIKVLKDLGIGIDYGFMLFQPDSNYKSIRDNLAFLEQVCQDGAMPVSFLKMMPYLATRVEKELREEGRLKGQPGFLDYDFLEGSMNEMYAFVSDCFASWLHAAEGATNLAKWGMSYLAVYDFLYGSPNVILKLSEELKVLVSEANQIVIETMRHLSAGFESESYSREGKPELELIKLDMEERHAGICRGLRNIITRVKVYAMVRHIIHCE